MLDGSQTRRGKPCWYKVEDVGMMAVNDALMVENCIYYILKKNFDHQPYYVKLMELFHEAMMITAFGQTLDMHMADKNVTSFTMDRYKAIVDNKTSFYSFYLPVALAMHMAGYFQKSFCIFHFL